jgi:trehalose 6-phosphate phosphatase
MIAAPLATLVERAEAAALFVDFDGSLAPIVDDPAAARPLPAARAALERLVPRLLSVAVVSGRPATFLRDALGLDGIIYAGVYGLERIVDGEVVVDPRVADWVDVIARAADEAEAALPGLHVERKGRVAVTVHWRRHPERGPAASQWADTAASRLGLPAPLRGRMAAELRPPVSVDKGTTVAALVNETGAQAAAFAGDDAGDLAAFGTLHALVDSGALEAAVSIGVASDEAPPEVLDADIVVDGPRGLAVLFDEWAEAISGRA